jgi:hypothetical protein
MENAAPRISRVFRRNPGWEKEWKNGNKVQVKCGIHAGKYVCALVDEQCK